MENPWVKGKITVLCCWRESDIQITCSEIHGLSADQNECVSLLLQRFERIEQRPPRPDK